MRGGWMFRHDAFIPISPSDISLSRSIAPSSSLSRNKKLNHRGRRARRDKTGKGLKAQRAREQAAPFSTLPKRPKLLRGFQKRTSAVSASSSVTLFSSSGQDPEKERLLFPKGEKNHKPQRSGRTQRG